MARSDEKFLFNMHMFNSDEDALDKQLAEGEEPPVIYEEAEYEAAKAAAFAEGRKQAETEAAASRAQHLTALMDTVAKNITALFAQEYLREKIYEREAVDLTLKIFKKLFPAYTAAHGFEELQGFITGVLEKHSGQKKISIFVEPDFAAGVEKFITPLSAQHQGVNFAITADESVKSGSCKIRWEDGGAVKNNEAIAEEILGILQDALAAGSAKGHDKDNDDDASVKGRETQSGAENPDE
ncbi:MAG: hypothetical protein IT559_06290 [Alphaproteobacteria bacterium]|nr:hypothetical protein [Alphaproteobacteria bacterium]